MSGNPALDQPEESLDRVEPRGVRRSGDHDPASVLAEGSEVVAGMGLGVVQKDHHPVSYVLEGVRV